MHTVHGLEFMEETSNALWNIEANGSVMFLGDFNTLRADLWYISTSISA